VVRSDLNPVSEELARIDTLAATFARFNREEWSHLKNREDFETVYNLDRAHRYPLEDLYGCGRDFAVYMNTVLESYHRVEEHPTFTSFVHYVGEWLDKNLPEFKAVLAGAEEVKRDRGTIPWAAKEMISLHATQLNMADSLYGWVTMAKVTTLYRKENNIMDESKGSTAPKQININTFQGIMGDVIHSTVEQNLKLEIVKGDFASVRSRLADLGITGSDIDQLETAIKADPPPVRSNAFGPEVSSWLGKILSQAAKGAYELSLATAGGVLAEILLKYYGLR
jgi:hypothetical protein